MRRTITAAGAALLLAGLVLLWPADPPPPTPPGPAGPGREPAAAPEPPAYLKGDTEFEKGFARIRQSFQADQRRLLEQGAAARTLLGSPEESIPILKAAALEDPNGRFRAWSIWLLGELKRAELAEEIFVRCLREDRFFGVRAASATALGKLGSRAWAAPLRQAAQSDPDLQVRHEASEALRAIGAEEAR